MTELPDGWGSIYCETWFGDYKNIHYSIPTKPDCLQPAYQYYVRVIADSGTLEAYDCANEAVIELKLT